MTPSGSRSCQRCLGVYSDGDPRHTEGNGRNTPKAQTLLFSHIIPLLLSLSLVQWYSAIEWNILSQSHYYFVKSHHCYCDPFPQKRARVFCSHNLKILETRTMKKKKKTFQKFLLNKENDESWYHSDYVTFRIFSTVKSHMFSSISLNSASIWVDRASLLHLPEVLVLKAYLEGIMSYSSCLSYTLNSCCLKKNIKLITERQRIIIKNPPFLLWSSVIRISTSTFGSVFSNSETKLHQCPYIRMSSWRGLTPASS